MNTASKLILACLVLTLSGCVTFGQKKEPAFTPQEQISEVAIPKTRPVELGEVKWTLMNPDVMAKWIEENKGKDVIIYAVDENNMKVAIDNIQELRRYIQQQQEVINYLVGIVDQRHKRSTLPKEPEKVASSPEK